MLELLRLVWKKIERVLKFIGGVQSTVLLSAFYFVVLAPVGVFFILMRLFQKHPNPRSYWKRRPEVRETEETLLRQF